MASCIHPSCICKAYQDPKHPKGTLLQLRLGCRRCGHHAAEHRQLTAVDRLLQKEVDKASNSRCTHIIAMADIPHSPLFGPYDPISIPFDDMPNCAENGARCTCVGFSTANIVSLWQKFRSYSMSDTLSALPSLSCSFCNHPLQSHQAPSHATASPLVSANAAPSPHLTLLGAARLPFVPLSTDVLQLVTVRPVNSNVGSVALVALTKSTKKGKEEEEEEEEEEVKLLVYKCSLDASEEGVSKSSVSEVCPTSNNLELASNGIQADSSITSPKPEVGESTVTSIDTPATRQDGEPLATKLASKTRKRSSDSATTTPQRRSKRLAAVRQTAPGKEPPKAKRKQQRGGGQQTIGVACSSGTGETVSLTVSLPQPALAAIAPRGCLGGSGLDPMHRASVKKGLTVFVSSLEKRECFSEYGLPKMTTPGPECVAVCSSVVESSSRTSILLLALAYREGRVAVCTLDTDRDRATSTLCTFKCPSSGTVRCFSWQEQSPTAHSLSTQLCTGTSDGTLHFGSIDVSAEASRTTCSPFKQEKHTEAQITAASWDRNGRFLAAGSFVGEVLLYSCLDEGSPPCHFQTLSCAGSTVTCLAWSSDSSVLAVGGSDDCVQVLHCPKPTNTRMRECGGKPANTLHNYFKADSGKREKFLHTHSLRGHQSFVAGVAVLQPSSQLLSVGWDGQLLLWHTTDEGSRPSHSHKMGIPYVDSEPVAGFKLGPSATVEHLPINIRNLLGSLAVVFVDKKGTTTIVAYSDS